LRSSAVSNPLRSEGVEPFAPSARADDRVRGGHFYSPIRCMRGFARRPRAQT
jgi:hypothetical protein